MIRRTQMLLSAAALAVVAGAVAVARLPAAAAPVSEESKRLIAAEIEIAQLRSEMQRERALNQVARAARVLPNAQQAAEGASAPVVAAAAQQDAPAAVPTPAPAKDLTTEDIRDTLSARFTEEAYDSKWSVVTREKVQSRLSSALPKGARMLSVDCKTSMCRAEIAEPDLEAHQQLIKSAFASPPTPWEGSTMLALAEEPGSGKVTTIAFIAREGQGLTLEDPPPSKQ